MWRKKGTGNNPNHTASSVKHGEGVVVTWECMAASGTGPLNITDDLMYDDSSRMNLEVYKTILPTSIQENATRFTGKCYKVGNIVFIVAAVTGCLLEILYVGFNFFVCSRRLTKKMVPMEFQRMKSPNKKLFSSVFNYGKSIKGATMEFCFQVSLSSKGRPLGHSRMWLYKSPVSFSEISKGVLQTERRHHWSWLIFYDFQMSKINHLIVFL